MLKEKARFIAGARRNRMKRVARHGTRLRDIDREFISIYRSLGFTWDEVAGMLASPRSTVVHQAKRKDLWQ